MRKLLVTLATAASALAVAAPASAQYYPEPRGHGYERSVRGDRLMRSLNAVERIRHDLARLASQGRLSRREAASFDRRAVQLGQQLMQFRRTGMSGGDLARFDRRHDRLRQQIRAHAGLGRGTNYRYNRYRDDRYDRDW